MFVVLEAMSDAGVLAGLPRAAAQDMVIYMMQVHMICTQEYNFSQCAMQSTIMCMIAVVHSCKYHNTSLHCIYC